MVAVAILTNRKITTVYLCNEMTDFDEI